MNDTTTTTLYVNVYDVIRNYGGPEEGGWWYDSGEPIESHPVTSMEEAEALRAELENDFPRTGKRYSVLGGFDYDIFIEDHPAEEWPAYRPHYE